MAEEQVTLENCSPNLAGENSERDARVKSYVMDAMKRVLNARQYLESKWLVMDRIYRGDPITRYYPVEDSTSVPEPFKMVEVQAPRVALALLPDQDWFRLVPKRAQSVEPEGAKALMQEQYKDGNLPDSLYRVVQNGAKYGTMIAKVPWVVDRRCVKVKQLEDKEKYNEAGEYIGSEEVVRAEEQTLNHDRTELLPLNIFDFVCDWRYRDPQLAPFAADYSRRTREDCLAAMNTEIEGGGKVYQGLTKEDLMQIGVVENPPELPGKDLQEYASNAQMISKNEENDISVLDWWGLLDPDNTGKREEYRVIILNDDHVVHISKNNLWHGKRPYLVSPWTPIENELYGIGVIEMIVRLAMDLNDNQNNINASSVLSANPMVKAGDAFNIPDQQFTVTPGRVLRGQDITQLQPFLIPDTTRVNRENKEDLRRDIDETVGSPRAWVAGTDVGSETATEFSGKQRAANIRLRPTIVRANSRIMQPLVDMSLSNNQQFLEEERTVLYTGNAGQYFRYQSTPKDLAGIARVIAKLPPQIELMGLRGQQMMAFMGAVAQLGPLAEQEPYRSMLKVSFINQFGYEDADRIWPEEAQRWRVPQREEITVMLKDVVVDVHETDNHAEHMAQLAEFMSTPEFARLVPNIKAKINAHYANHEFQFRLQEEEAGQLPPPEQMEEAAMVAGGGTPAIPGEAEMGTALEGVAQGRIIGENARIEAQGQ